MEGGAPQDAAEEVGSLAAAFFPPLPLWVILGLPSPWVGGVGWLPTALQYWSLSHPPGKGR